MRPGSPNSSISEDRINLKQPICLAKALVDCLPSSYDKEALRFMVSYYIDVVYACAVAKLILSITHFVNYIL